jgi:hypothetical protein
LENWRIDLKPEAEKSGNQSKSGLENRRITTCAGSKRVENGSESGQENGRPSHKSEGREMKNRINGPLKREFAGISWQEKIENRAKMGS